MNTGKMALPGKDGFTRSIIDGDHNNWAPPQPLDDARQNRVPDTAWSTIAAALSGSYIQYGNQIFGSTSPAQNWSPEQISQRIALINQMLAVTASPTGRQALQNALTSVASRLPK